MTDSPLEEIKALFRMRRSSGEAGDGDA